MLWQRVREFCHTAFVKGTIEALRHEFKRLFHSMDFVARHPSLNRRGKEGERLAEVYQQLGQLWEFLALRCPHHSGWITTRDERCVCQLCGTAINAEEQWLLLPRQGKKVIGRKAQPNSAVTFANKKKATVVHDTIQFHGATVTADVHNSYRSKLFHRSKLDIAVAAERTVRVEEDGIECSLSGSQVRLRLKKHQMGERPPYGAFVAELPKRVLKKFPLLVEFDSRGKLVGIDIFRPIPSAERKRASKRPRAA